MNIHIKTDEEIKIMAEGGAKLSRVKNQLKDAIKIGVNAIDIEKLAVKLIEEEGAQAAFKKVPGYRWATCISINEGLVHGIPTPNMIFKKGDLVSVDTGIYYKGFYTDTSISVGLDLTPENKKFLNVGKMALEKAISKCREGNYIYDISSEIEKEIEKHGYSTIKALVGHGVGRELHEEPQIPCFLPGKITESPKIKKGMVLAVEVMYAMGSDKVHILEDGWTIAMRDGKIAGLFEETVAVTSSGPKILT
ncbi:MAG TPA: type I methionyl aminopeptidase [Alphaproteobacteria bacterium]|jgi:methionyl aminopeptidase|nr:type I methionyl aminopeptidase [Alphaproteobacteria bacterium]